MKPTKLIPILLVVLAIPFLSFDMPKDWFKAGSKPKSYEMGIALGEGMDGKDCATIKSNSTKRKIDGFGTLMQQCKPTKFLGKRIKMTAYVKSENVKKWAGLWLRVDQANSQTSLSFDNMGDRPITGTTAWKSYEIILDVPTNASRIAYGALLEGTGQVWFGSMQFEIVDNTVKTTDLGKHDLYDVTEPTNLNFDKKK